MASGCSQIRCRDRPGNETTGARILQRSSFRVLPGRFVALGVCRAQRCCCRPWCRQGRGGVLSFCHSSRDGFGCDLTDQPSPEQLALTGSRSFSPTRQRPLLRSLYSCRLGTFSLPRSCLRCRHPGRNHGRSTVDIDRSRQGADWRHGFSDDCGVRRRRRHLRR